MQSVNIIWYIQLATLKLWCCGLDNADIMVLEIRQCSHYDAGD